MILPSVTFEIGEFPGKSAIDHLDTELRRAMEEAVGVLAGGAARMAPVRTGFLRSSVGALHVTGKFSSGSLMGRVVAMAPYAPFVEFGVQPSIRQSRRGNLFFHRGQEPQPFMQDALDLSESALAETFMRAIDIGFQRAA